MAAHRRKFLRTFEVFSKSNLSVSFKLKKSHRQPLKYLFLLGLLNFEKLCILRDYFFNLKKKLKVLILKKT